MQHTDLSDAAIDALEAKFPPLAKVAFAAAFKRARATGLPVVISEENSLFRLHPDGRREFLRNIEPRARVEIGKPIKLR